MYPGYGIGPKQLTRFYSHSTKPLLTMQGSCLNANLPTNNIGNNNTLMMLLFYLLTTVVCMLKNDKGTKQACYKKLYFQSLRETSLSCAPQGAPKYCLRIQGLQYALHSDSCVWQRIIVQGTPRWCVGLN